MENHLKLFLPLSLKELGLRKVAALFSSNSTVLKFFDQSLYSRLPSCEVKEWLKVTEEKMLKLGLPESLNKQVVDRIRAIFLEIKEWKERNCSVAEFELPVVSKLCCTSTGGIDKKLADQYVLWDRLENWRRYEIACRNCMENHLPLLWHKLSKKEKAEYKMGGRVARPECCWPYILEGKQSELDHLGRKLDRNVTSFNQVAFQASANIGNRVAAEYFFQKLTPEEREASLMRTACNVFDGNVLFYLLSLMTPKQQIELVEARPIEVLFCFLDWPRRHLLPENAGLIWTFLRESDYGILLQRVDGLLRLGYKSFPKCCPEFLKSAPLDFIKKSFVGHESDLCRVLCALIDYEDSESIEVMLRHADAASRVKLLFCDAVFSCFYYCILNERWDGVVACLRDSTLSAKGRGTLKESFMRYLDEREGGVREKREFRRFFEFLHETDASDDKEKKVKRLKLQ